MLNSRTGVVCSAACLLIAVPGEGLAQAAQPPAVDANTTPYPASYFAEYRPVTALDMLGRVPGFQFDGGTSARGFAGTAGNVLIDGERPPTRSDSLASVLSRIPASQVIRIDIVRAGAGGLDMQGKPVVANVIRRPDGGVTGSTSANLSLNSTGQPQATVSGQVQRQRSGQTLDGSLRLSGGSQEVSSVTRRSAPDGGLLRVGLNDGDVDFSNGEGTAVYEGPMAGGRIRANALINYNGSVYSGTSILIVPGGQELNGSDAARWRAETGVRWTRSLPFDANLEIVGFQSLTLNDNLGAYSTPFFTSETDSEQVSAESIVSATLRFAEWDTPVGPTTFEAGSEVALNSVETTTEYLFNGGALPIPGDETRVEELRNESFVTSVWSAREDLRVEANLRYEVSRITAEGSAGNAETSLDYLKPRLSATWTGLPRTTITVKLEKSVDQLSFGAFTSSASFATNIFGLGNPEIRPAQIWSGSARYERLFGTQGSFVAEFVHESLDDVLGAVVVYATPPGASAPMPFNIIRNVGEATRDRLSLSSRIPLDDWGLKGAIFNGLLGYRWSDTVDPVTFSRRDFGDQNGLSWSVSLSRNIVAQRINWNVGASNGVSGATYGPSTLVRFRNDPTYSASITYKPDARLSVTGGIFVGSDSISRFTLFNAPRNIGSPIYVEDTRGLGTSQVYVSVRRGF